MHPSRLFLSASGASRRKQLQGCLIFAARTLCATSRIRDCSLAAPFFGQLGSECPPAPFCNRLATSPGSWTLEALHSPKPKPKTETLNPSLGDGCLTSEDLPIMATTLLETLHSSGKRLCLGLREDTHLLQQGLEEVIVVRGDVDGQLLQHLSSCQRMPRPRHAPQLL